MAGYPSSQPAWQQSELNRLAAAGQLSGVNPLVLAGIEQGESGFENAGAGINSSGYGGYFGLGQHSTYSFGGQSFTETPQILGTNSVASFDQQAQATGAEVARELQAYGGNLYGALVTSGAFYAGDYNAAESYLGGASPMSGKSSSVTGSAQGVAQNAGASANLAGFPGGSLDPLNWPGEIGSAGGSAIASGILGVIQTITAPLRKFVEDAGLVVLGIVLFFVALALIVHGAGGSSSTSSPQPVEIEEEEPREEEHEEHEGEEEPRHEEGEEEPHQEHAAPPARSSSSSRSSRRESASEARGLESEAERVGPAVAAAAG